MQLLDRSTTRRAVKPAHTAADQVERVELVRPPGLVAAELLQKGFHVTPRRVVPQRAIRAVEHPDPVRRNEIGPVLVTVTGRSKTFDRLPSLRILFPFPFQKMFNLTSPSARW